MVSTPKLKNQIKKTGGEAGGKAASVGNRLPITSLTTLTTSKENKGRMGYIEDLWKGGFGGEVVRGRLIGGRHD